jgi:hypothetical protein
LRFAIRHSAGTRKEKGGPSAGPPP